ncbi:2870_t:CDS:2, partial [Acaulospora morrowiae]
LCAREGEIELTFDGNTPKVRGGPIIPWKSRMIARKNINTEDIKNFDGSMDQRVVEDENLVSASGELRGEYTIKI